MRRHRVQNKYTINFNKKIQEARPRAGLFCKGKALSSYNLSVTADAVPPPLPRRGFGSPRKVNGFARGSPTRGAVEELATRLRGCTKDSLTVSRSGENLSVIADAMPPPLARGGLGIPQSLAFSPEAPLGRGAVRRSLTERFSPYHLPNLHKYDLLRKYE